MEANHHAVGIVSLTHPNQLLKQSAQRKQARDLAELVTSRGLFPWGDTTIQDQLRHLKTPEGTVAFHRLRDGTIRLEHEDTGGQRHTYTIDPRGDSERSGNTELLVRIATESLKLLPVRHAAPKSRLTEIFDDKEFIKSIIQPLLTRAWQFATLTAPTAAGKIAQAVKLTPHDLINSTRVVYLGSRILIIRDPAWCERYGKRSLELWIIPAGSMPGNGLHVVGTRNGTELETTLDGKCCEGAEARELIAAELESSVTAAVVRSLAATVLRDNLVAEFTTKIITIDDETIAVSRSKSVLGEELHFSQTTNERVSIGIASGELSESNALDAEELTRMLGYARRAVERLWKEKDCPEFELMPETMKNPRQTSRQRFVRREALSQRAFLSGAL